MKNLFSYLDKRKSFRNFDPNLSVSSEELDMISQYLDSIIGLNPTIKTAHKIVKASETSAKFGEYCLLFYSESHSQQLLNAGYILEILDLYMASINIGACWYGLARTKEKTYQNLEYVIMLAFGKVDLIEFRQSRSDYKRKLLTELWEGDFNQTIKELTILAPSACNSQPWRFKSSSSRIDIYRKQSIKTIMPLGIRSHYNMIDMGIVIAFLIISLNQYQYHYKIELPIVFSTKEDLVYIASIIIYEEATGNDVKR